MDSLEFKRELSQLEFYLSMGAAIPVLGTIAGNIKIALGIIQTIGGILALVFSLFFICNENGGSIFRNGFSHTVNGMANIAAGSLESIPFVGTAILFLRVGWFHLREKNTEIYARTGQEFAVFIGYHDLEKNPIKAIGTYGGQKESNFADLKKIGPLICF